MFNKIFKMRKSLLLIGIACIVTLHSCSTCARRQTVEDVDIYVGSWFMDSAHIELARTVLYALPTPVELSLLIRNSGIPWNPALLNDPTNASKYLTGQKMALNFGVYVTNLTYAGLFEQAQTMLRYKAAISYLIDRMGLQSALNTNTLQLLEQNINDRNMVLRIISEIYASCSAFLDENERYSMGLAILVGGWVESMHLATSTLDENLFVNQERMRQLVIDQMMSFDIMWQAMSDLKEIPGVDELLKGFTPLAQIFDRIGIHQEPNVTSIFEATDVTEIASINVVDVSPEEFENIKIQIQILRDNLINI